MEHLCLSTGNTQYKVSNPPGRCAFDTSLGQSVPPLDSGQGLALQPRRRCHPAPAPEHFVPGPRARVLPLHPAQTLPPCTRLGGQSSKPPYAKAGLSLCLDGPAFACVVDISLDIVFSADIILAIMFDITARCCS